MPYLVVKSQSAVFLHVRDTVAQMVALVRRLVQTHLCVFARLGLLGLCVKPLSVKSAIRARITESVLLGLWMGVIH